jgi:phenylacetate-coenzyme A ligase PaaK-like adenylate-forming protein
MNQSDSIFKIQSEKDFEAVALEVFRFQFENNPVYRSYCDLLYKHPSDTTNIVDIPFLPIEFFKSKKVVSTSQNPQIIFTSSGTTGSQVSRHYVTDIKLYEDSFTRTFEHFYGSIDDYVILGLLPSYLEREGSSLIYMVNHFIQKSKFPESGFYLNQWDELAEKLKTLELSGKKSIVDRRFFCPA